MVKKTLTLLLICTLSLGAFAQSFYKSQKLKPKQFHLALEPAVILNGEAHFMLFMHGGVGLTRGVDFNLSFGTFSHNNYLGANVGFGIGQYLSASFGAHHFDVFGLDGSLLANYPLRSDIRLFIGGDMHMNLYDQKAHLLVWLPVGIEIGLKKNISFVFETSIGLSKPAYSLIGAGINFYI